MKLKFVGILSWLLQYFPKNRAILFQKLGVDKKFVKIRFPPFCEKNPTALKPERGGVERP